MATTEVPGRLSTDGGGASSPPEFAFWMVGNHPEDQTDLLTADELFVDGVLLPLHLLSLHRHDPKPEPQPPHQTEPDLPLPSAAISSAGQPPSGSKRWRDIFKVVGDKKQPDDNKDRRSKGDRKSSSAGNAAAELNIHIWPFSRSRSAGNATAGTSAARSRASAAGARKSSSAPCSRSNSRGESSKLAAASGVGASRRWAASPGRGTGGVHLGRASPVWQLRRPAKEKPPAGRKGSGGGARGLSLNVNTCMGYRSQVSCGSDGAAAGAGDRTGGNGSLFNLRTLFSKKVY